MAKRFTLGKGSHFNPSKMHSSRGIKTFKMLSPLKQKAWFAWDPSHSRRGLMHPSRGTKTFKTLPLLNQKAWFAWDPSHSRPATMKQWGTHGHGGSHKR